MSEFNLVDEPWIPIVDKGNVSLLQVFSDTTLKGLGGNPAEKISLFKLLLAIAQSAWTPTDDKEWSSGEEFTLSERCQDYLRKNRRLFDLYGDRPFLQMPAILMAEKCSFGVVLPEVSTGNTTILTHYQVEKALYTDAEKALILVQLMGFALGGKKTDNTVVLSHGYTGKQNDKGKPSTGKPGPFVGFKGFLHSFLWGQTLGKTIWMNLWTQEDISAAKYFSEGLGVPPWEEMPKGEDCPVARRLKNSLMGRLVPLSRFCFLEGEEVHYSEGIFHLDYKDGGRDPSVAYELTGHGAKPFWVDPEMRPWRRLTALLSFVFRQSTTSVECFQLGAPLKRVARGLEEFGVWSGGLSVSSNAGEQYVSGGNDYVESIVYLTGSDLNASWFEHLQLEMKNLEDLAKVLYLATLGYYRDQKEEPRQSKRHAGMAQNVFWQLCERRFQDLVDSCDESEKVKDLRRQFASALFSAFDNQCPKETPRQLDAWAKRRPMLRDYLRHSFQIEEGVLV